MGDDTPSDEPETPEDDGIDLPDPNDEDTDESADPVKFTDSSDETQSEPVSNPDTDHTQSPEPESNNDRAVIASETVTDPEPYPGVTESETATDADAGAEDESESFGESVLRRSKTAMADATDTITAVNYLTGIKATFAYLGVLLLVPVSVLLGALPASWRLYRRITRWATWQMQKAASADAVGNVRLPSGKEDIRPAAWVSGEEDEKDRSGWKVLGLDGRYDPAVHGRSTQRLGKADMLHVDADATEVGTWGECTIDNALQLDRERYLLRDAEVTIQQLVYDADPSDQPAVADGGYDPTEQYRTTEVSLSKPGILEDALIPLNSASGYGGQVVAWNQYSNLKEQQSDQETIRDAKNSAWAAAKLDDIGGVEYLKWALIIGGWSALLLFKDAIAAFIAGLGGGGGSGGGAVGSAVSGGIGSVNVAPVAMDLVATAGVM